MFEGLKRADQVVEVAGAVMAVTATAMTTHRAAAVPAAVRSVPECTDLTVLIIGKTGNGKSFVGNAILQQTPRKFPERVGMRAQTTGIQRERVAVGRNVWTVC
jgi:predicted GTPase